MASGDSGLLSPSISEDKLCNFCNQQYEKPRVLSCLHVFCEACIEKMLDNKSSPGVLACPDCEQETKVHKGVSSLPLDYITSNLLEMQAIKNMQVICTSCKAKEKAVARCSDCSTFLCSNCVTAHQYMRCFENHKVVSFDDMEASGDSLTIHKPLTCPSHSGEQMKYYCHTCQTPICNECMVLDHKQPEHHYERASEAERKSKEELENLIAESKRKVPFCEEASSALEACLSDLQLQRDSAKSHIQETLQSYKAILEKCQEEVLKELESLHKTQELLVMDTFQTVGKTIEKIQEACKFADKLLKHGNAIEILSLKQIVSSQLLYLINNTPKPDISKEITFETDPDTFEQCIRKNFGHIKKPEQPAKVTECTSPPGSSPIRSTPSYEGEGFALPAGVLSPESPLPNLDMDLANNAVARYNLAQLAGLSENTVSCDPVVSSPLSSPISLGLSDLLIPATCQDPGQLNALTNNLTVLAKLNSLSLNSGFSVDVGSQVRSNVTTPNLGQPIRGMQPPSVDLGLVGLLNGTSGINSQPGNIPHVETSMLNGTSTVLSQSLSSPLSSRVLSPASSQSSFPSIRTPSGKLNNMQIRCKFGQLGQGKGQFSSPHGFCLGIDEEVVVADTNNHRIQIFDKMGEFKHEFGTAGKEEGQLWYPRKVAVMRGSGKFVICDRGNERSRMQIFSKSGHFLKKIVIRYIDIVAGLAITNDGNIVAVDSVSPTVFIIAETGDLLHWFDCSDYMREPSDIAVSGKQFYICDFKGHCVVVFNEMGQQVRRIGCESVTNFPNGIDISDAGDVLIGDSHGNRFHVVVYSREGVLLSEFECPYVKVSRCCGLKITSEGYIVTLAKNNHHVLILNTLYIV